MKRLDASSQTARERPSSVPVYRYCIECMAPFRPRRSDQKWCGDPKCRKATYRRWDQRARRLYHLTLEVRTNRHGQRTLTDISALVAQWTREDRLAGRPTHDPELIGIIGRIYDA